MLIAKKDCQYQGYKTPDLLSNSILCTKVSLRLAHTIAGVCSMLTNRLFVGASLFLITANGEEKCRNMLF